MILCVVLLAQDTLDGGGDNDYLSYYNSDEGVNINLKEGTASGGYAEGDTIISVERINWVIL